MGTLCILVGTPSRDTRSVISLNWRALNCLLNTRIRSFCHIEMKLALVIFVLRSFTTLHNSHLSGMVVVFEPVIAEGFASTGVEPHGPSAEPLLAFLRSEVGVQ